MFFEATRVVQDTWHILSGGALVDMWHLLIGGKSNVGG